MNVLITGAAGFIGRNLARYLTATGHRVTCVDDLSIPPTGPLPERLDKRDVRGLTATDLQDAEAIVHLAARKNVPDSFRDHHQLLHNIDVDSHLLRIFATATGPRRLLLASSCEVYGARPEPCAEHHHPAPRSPYAAGKVLTEYLAAIFQMLHPGKQFCCLRLHNIYGPYEGPDAVVPAFLDAVAEGRPIRIEGDGSQARDFSHIDDLVAMLYNVLTDPKPLPPILNLGSGTATRIADLADHVRDAAGHGTVPTIFDPPRPNEIPVFRADTTAYTARYGPVATRPLPDAIRAALHTRAGYRETARR
jgi:nucleoside-diphosphate-sugar epimerase